MMKCTPFRLPRHVVMLSLLLPLLVNPHLTSWAQLVLPEAVPDTGDPAPGETDIVDLGNGVFIEMVWIPSGEFVMGSPEDEPGREDNEGPRHRVLISRGFWMGKYEVTQAQWGIVMKSNPSHFPGLGQLPVEMVSWADCIKFIKKLNILVEGGGFCLPSEAEWEYTCRAGASARFYWGDDPDYSRIALHAWQSANSGRCTHPVGKLRGNSFGVYDMSGNVWEWCNDWYADYSGEQTTDPSGPTSGKYRVLRGGSWYNPPQYARSAKRHKCTPGESYFSFGFRLLRRL